MTLAKQGTQLGIKKHLQNAKIHILYVYCQPFITHLIIT